MNDKSVAQKQYKQAALSIAFALCRDAIWDGDRCNWLATTAEENSQHLPTNYTRALGSGLYDGLAGVAWFLLHASFYSDNPLVKKTAKGALSTLIHQEFEVNKTNNYPNDQLGFYTGYTGIAYVLFQCSHLCQEPHYAELATQLIERAMAIPKEQWGLDVIDGAAGAIPALIFIHERKPRKDIKQFILDLAAFLLEKAETRSNGMSWPTMPNIQHNLTGFGHGTAGFANAFAEMYHFTGDQTWLNAVREIVRYEDSHFNPQQENWPDFRNFHTSSHTHEHQDEVHCSLAWCHGAPGIGLSRLRIYELSKDPYYLSGIQAAIRSTQKHLNVYSIGNYSMCHGLFGNAELLLYGAEILHDLSLQQVAEDIAHTCIREYIAKGIPIPNGLQMGGSTPDFMLGMSGIGYFFLRLIDGKRHQCMLLPNGGSLFGGG